MIETHGDLTVIRPTPHKWYTGAAVTLLLGLVIPGAGIIMFPCALLFAGLASGNLQSLELSPQGIKANNLWKTRSYRWDDVENFQVMSQRTSLFSSTKHLAFTRKDKKDTFEGKATRLLIGGTETVPLSGISTEEMMACIGGYLARAEVMPQSAGRGGDFGTLRAPAAAPVKPKNKPSDADAIGFGRPASSGTPPKAAEPVFGRQSPSKPIPRSQPQRRKAPTSDPLVQEGGLFRKRRDISGF